MRILPDESERTKQKVVFSNMNTTTDNESHYPLAQYGEAYLCGEYYEVYICNDAVIGRWVAPVKTFQLWYFAQVRFKYCVPGDDWIDD